jgi:hypothetical protein
VGIRMFMRLRRLLLRCLSTFLYLSPSHLNPGRDSECECFLNCPSLLPSPPASRLNFAPTKQTRPPRAQRPPNQPASAAFSRAATRRTEWGAGAVCGLAFCWVCRAVCWLPRRRFLVLISRARGGDRREKASFQGRCCLAFRGVIDLLIVF